MRNWKDTLVAPETSLRDALTTIDRAASQIALVVDAQQRLLGTMSDGDIRRALLRGLGLADPASVVMHATPVSATTGDDRSARLAIMRTSGVHHLPVLDNDGVVVGLETVDDYLNVQERDEWVVIMAGGLGSRLKELTRDVPKPMLKVGTKPLLETIVRSYVDQGFRNFYFAVNYKAEQIEAHFGDGKGLGINIFYIYEQQRMGTAGALSLLPARPTQPIVVTNADILTKEDCSDMLDQHIASGVHATMGVRDYEMQVPFGVVHETNGYIHRIEEKPVQHFLVSAGMYVLSPEVLDLVPKSQFFDMPDLFEAVIAADMTARSHRINGYWLDIGRMPDYERANTDFESLFG